MQPVSATTVMVLHSVWCVGTKCAGTAHALVHNGVSATLVRVPAHHQHEGSHSARATTWCRSAQRLARGRARLRMELGLGARHPSRSGLPQRNRSTPAPPSEIGAGNLHHLVGSLLATHRPHRMVEGRGETTPIEHEEILRARGHEIQGNGRGTSRWSPRGCCGNRDRIHSSKKPRLLNHLLFPVNRFWQLTVLSLSFLATHRPIPSGFA